MKNARIKSDKPTNQQTIEKSHRPSDEVHYKSLHLMRTLNYVSCCAEIAHAEQRCHHTGQDNSACSIGGYNEAVRHYRELQGHKCLP